MTPGESHNEWYQYYCSNFCPFKAKEISSGREITNMESFAIQRIAWLHWNPDQSALDYYLIVSFRVYIGPAKLAATTESENNVEKVVLD